MAPVWLTIGFLSLGRPGLPQGQRPYGLPQGQRHYGLPKDKDPMVNQSSAICWFQCGDLGCDNEYIGETSWTFGEMYKEHLKAPSAIHLHSSQTGHPTNHNNFQIIGREGHNLARSIKESIYIRVNNPTLNNNIGKFNLPHIWDRVLFNTKSLNLKRQVNNNNTQLN